MMTAEALCPDWTCLFTLSFSLETDLLPVEAPIGARTDHPISLPEQVLLPLLSMCDPFPFVHQAESHSCPKSLP